MFGEKRFKEYEEEKKSEPPKNHDKVAGAWDNYEKFSEKMSESADFNNRCAIVVGLILGSEDIDIKKKISKDFYSKEKKRIEEDLKKEKSKEAEAARSLKAKFWAKMGSIKDKVKSFIYEKPKIKELKRMFPYNPDCWHNFKLLNDEFTRRKNDLYDIWCDKLAKGTIEDYCTNVNLPEDLKKHLIQKYAIDNVRDRSWSVGRSLSYVTTAQALNQVSFVNDRAAIEQQLLEEEQQLDRAKRMSLLQQKEEKQKEVKGGIYGNRQVRIESFRKGKEARDSDEFDYDQEEKKGDDKIKKEYWDAELQKITIAISAERFSKNRVLARISYFPESYINDFNAIFFAQYNRQPNWKDFYKKEEGVVYMLRRCLQHNKGNPVLPGVDIKIPKGDLIMRAFNLSKKGREAFEKDYFEAYNKYCDFRDRANSESNNYEIDQIYYSESRKILREVNADMSKLSDQLEKSMIENIGSISDIKSKVKLSILFEELLKKKPNINNNRPPIQLPKGYNMYEGDHIYFSRPPVPARSASSEPTESEESILFEEVNSKPKDNVSEIQISSVERVNKVNEKEK